MYVLEINQRIATVKNILVDLKVVLVVKNGLEDLIVIAEIKNNPVDHAVVAEVKGITCKFLYECVKIHYTVKLI